MILSYHPSSPTKWCTPKLVHYIGNVLSECFQTTMVKHGNSPQQTVVVMLFTVLMVINLNPFSFVYGYKVNVQTYTNLYIVNIDIELVMNGEM